MAIPVIDLLKLNGDERADTMAQIAACCEECGFFQLINHGISDELLEKVKKVASDCYKLERESSFKKSKPVQLLNELIESNFKTDEKLENVDWEDAFLLSDNNGHQWPSQTPAFNNKGSEKRNNKTERDWWKKKFTGSSDSDQSRVSSNSSGGGGGSSSRSRSCGGQRKRHGFVKACSCCPFFKSKDTTKSI